MQDGVNTLIALVAGLATAVVLTVVLRALARRVRLVKQLLFPLTLAALVAGLKLYTLLDPPRRGPARGGAERHLAAIDGHLAPTAAKGL